MYHALCLLAGICLSIAVCMEALRLGGTCGSNVFKKKWIFYQYSTGYSTRTSVPPLQRGGTEVHAVPTESLFAKMKLWPNIK